MLLTGILMVLAAAASAAAEPRYLGEFRITYYHVAVEDSRYEGASRDELLLDLDGCELARVSSQFRRALDLEGTGRLADGRVVNVAHKTPDGWRYVDLGPAHWGVGVAGVPLLPFRSVAADPGRLKSGSRIFLPQFASVILPNGSIHGGWFVVDDVGSAIRENRLDIFIGDEAHLAGIEAIVASHDRTPVFARVEGPEVVDMLQQRP